MILYDFICIHNLGISYPVIHCNPVPWHGSFRCPGPAPFVLDAGHGFRGGFSAVRTGTGGSGAGAASFRWGNGWKMASYGETIGETITI